MIRIGPIAFDSEGELAFSPEGDLVDTVGRRRDWRLRGGSHLTVLTTPMGRVAFSELEPELKPEQWTKLWELGVRCAPPRSRWGPSPMAWRTSWWRAAS